MLDIGILNNFLRAIMNHLIRYFSLTIFLGMVNTTSWGMEPHEIDLAPQEELLSMIRHEIDLAPQKEPLSMKRHEIKVLKEEKNKRLKAFFNGVKRINDQEGSILKCKYENCSKEFKGEQRQDHLEKHILDEHFNFKCQTCSRLFKRGNYFINHLVQEGHSCCNDLTHTDSKSDISVHLKSNHPPQGKELKSFDHNIKHRTSTNSRHHTFLSSKITLESFDQLFQEFSQ